MQEDHSLNRPETGNSLLQWEWLILVIVTGTLLARLAVSEPLLSANDRSRWCTVWSLVERGTYQIDEITTYRGWDTIDKVRHEEHYYSSKPPLLPTVVAGVYYLVKNITGLTLTRQLEDCTRLILLIVNVIPLIMTFCLWMKILNRYATKNWTKLFLLSTVCFGTLLSPFALTFNNHTVAAISVVWTLYLAFEICIEKKNSSLLFILCGITAAWTCCNELPAALFSVAIFIFLCRSHFQKTVLFFIPAALLVLGGWFYTNYLCTGGIKPFYAYYGTEKYRYVVDGIPSYWMQVKGIDQGLDSPLVYLMNCTIGHHGIFSLTPIFLFCVPGWFLALTGKENKLKPFQITGLVLTVVLLGFYLTRTQNYNYGGVSSGLRWSFWLIPFLILALIPVLDCCSSKKMVRFLASVCLVGSIFSASWPGSQPWQHPWLWDTFQAQGWIKNPKNQVKELSPEMTTFFRSLPEVSEEEKFVRVEFECEMDEGLQILRLTTYPKIQKNSRTVQAVHLEKEVNGRVTNQLKMEIDVEKFQTGLLPSQFIVSSNLKDAKLISRLVFGLPVEGSYRPGRTEYLKTNVRKNAYQCQKVYSTHIEDRDGVKHGLKSEVWVSDEVPFGVAQWVLSISNRSTGNMVYRHRYTLRSLGE